MFIDHLQLGLHWLGFPPAGSSTVSPDALSPFERVQSSTLQLLEYPPLSGGLLLPDYMVEASRPSGLSFPSST